MPPPPPACPSAAWGSGYLLVALGGLVKAEPAPAFDFDQSGPELEFDQSLR